MKRLKISGKTQNISYIENYYDRYQIEDEEHRFFLKEIFDFQLVNKINEVDLESFSTASKYNQNYFLTIPSFFIQDENGEQKSIKGITSNKLESWDKYKFKSKDTIFGLNNPENLGFSTKAIEGPVIFAKYNYGETWSQIFDVDELIISFIPGDTPKDDYLEVSWREYMPGGIDYHNEKITPDWNLGRNIKIIWRTNNTYESKWGGLALEKRTGSEPSTNIQSSTWESDVKYFQLDQFKSGGGDREPNIYYDYNYDSKQDSSKLDFYAYRYWPISNKSTYYRYGRTVFFTNFKPQLYSTVLNFSNRENNYFRFNNEQNTWVDKLGNSQEGTLLSDDYCNDQIISFQQDLWDTLGSLKDEEDYDYSGLWKSLHDLDFKGFSLSPTIAEEYRVANEDYYFDNNDNTLKNSSYHSAKFQYLNPTKIGISYEIPLLYGEVFNFSPTFECETSISCYPYDAKGAGNQMGCVSDFVVLPGSSNNNISWRGIIPLGVTICADNTYQKNATHVGYVECHDGLGDNEYYINHRTFFTGDYQEDFWGNLGYPWGGFNFFLKCGLRAFTGAQIIPGFVNNWFEPKTYYAPPAFILTQSSIED